MFLQSNLELYFLLLLFSASSVRGKNYRSDYEYNRKTDGFYKFHIEAVTFLDAKATCDIEGAALIAPSSDADVEQVSKMFKNYPDIENYMWSGNDVKNHERADLPALYRNQRFGFSTQHLCFSDASFPLHSYSLVYGHTLSSEMYRELNRRFAAATTFCEVMTRHGDVKTTECARHLPFACKVSAKDIYYDTKCDVYGRGYQYFENVGSCYKISKKAYSWNQAYDECQNEGAHLVVLNSQLERDVVRNLIHNNTEVIQFAQFSFFFFAGLRAPRKSDGTVGVFKTIFNQTLEEAGFSEWSDGEPNNSFGNEFCGCIFKYNGKYNDIDCKSSLGFICEKEVST